MSTATHTVRFHRVIRTPPERVYRAFLDADAMAKWLPPNGYTGKVHALDASLGGAYRMSFTHFASGHSHAFGGTYLELEPHSRIRYTAAFDDPNLPGEMQNVRNRTDHHAGGHRRSHPDRRLLSRMAGNAGAARCHGRGRDAGVNSAAGPGCGRFEDSSRRSRVPMARTRGNGVA